MFDLISTLDPANGLTRGWEMRAPEADRPMWSVAVDIGGAHPVGACGAGRMDTVTRAAGEAVERFALVPGDGLESVVAPARSLPGALDFAGASLGDPLAVDESLRWYRGSWLDSGEPVWVPAGMVDHPADTPWFDSTPSGAAAGPDLEFAARAALLEWIERDAVAVAWATGAGVRRVEPPAGRVRRLLESVRDVEPRLVSLPVLPGLTCVMAAVVDGPALAAVGAKAHHDAERAMLVAVQESLQVRAALLAMRAEWGEVTAPDVVRNDADRARLYLTPAAVSEVRERLSDLPLTELDPGPEMALDELVAAVVADGGRPALVDLSARLPAPHRAMGWRAVKVVVPGYQPLRMDERHAFGWRHDRMKGAVGSFPHPLI
ncbi:YcaO-like family protein [Lentzea sp. BCCO 10_0798]|uniref:YcaO-like family protein n=1 Tax=Lentzea kristufekii TaxID=3095430 RepID=A0ABU4TPZ6_9PSEU|nr:YcaO-like family protein [Lentzea sp. BCCO 10_0798]MDX8049921.1 YcaO-like family protein [Lentzea sp. BCCO 10_0798]